MTDQTTHDVTKYEIEGALHFDHSPRGLVKAVISTPLCTGEIYLQGAHVAHWTPAGQKPVLFMSSKSLFVQGKAIRGGVPIIFPWFGARSDGKPGPQHGFARTMGWNVESSSLRSDGVLEIAFGLAAEEYEVRFLVAMGTVLEMSLDIRNAGQTERRFEDALHTYLAVSDVRHISVSGLDDTVYIDKTDDFQRKRHTTGPVRVAKETDSLYLNTETTCIVDDPGFQRNIVVEKRGSASTVVWNPWIEKSAGMADMGSDDWQKMVCVESANASDNAISLPAGASHNLSATIHVAR